MQINKPFLSLTYFTNQLKVQNFFYISHDKKITNQKLTLKNFQKNINVENLLAIKKRGKKWKIEKSGKKKSRKKRGKYFFHFFPI